ncbi:hypothetical protein LPB140_04025 [Sphingorhabdus lutea]|uniref:DUF3035 domain-containing protein n=1 Tax=Sphingorhabdus lutea TaxID=1913578 RepID=A0A1L3JAM3_9SPHN|nr:hypothetical protein [Sphingorhabdus lutea]APG62113.1 hypothetical protein LPB140_04025 [Sphingorhabdus lutea]
MKILHKRNIKNIWLAGICAAGLISCGKVADLTPKDGWQSAPNANKVQKEYAADKEKPSLQQMTTPQTQASPTSNAELLKKSEPRVDDPFDLRPGDAGNVGKNAEEDKKAKASKPK